MSMTIVRRLLEVKLNSLSPSIPTAWENVSFTPQVGIPWQQATVLPAKTENDVFGDKFRRLTGLFEILLNYPSNEGSQAAYARSDTLLIGFERGVVMQEGSVRVMVDAHPYIGAGFLRGPWFTLAVNVPYIADVQD